MKNKTWLWITVAVLVLALLVGGMLFLYRKFAPQFQVEEKSTGSTEPGDVPGKHITVTVTHKDGSSKEFTYDTDEVYLGTVLKEDDLIDGEEGPYGMMITMVDGETADWNVDQGYWALYVGDEYAVTGIDQTPIHDGDHFSLVYTIG